MKLAEIRKQHCQLTANRSHYSATRSAHNVTVSCCGRPADGLDCAVGLRQYTSI